MTEVTAGTRGLREVDLRLGYDTADEALREFYVPTLSVATRYDRSVGYFRASALRAAAKGMSRFIAGGGSARFLVGAELAEGDCQALTGATEIPRALAESLAHELVPADEIASQRLAVLAWLVKEGRLEIRVAVAIDEHGIPVPSGVEVPYFHEKIGTLRDAAGDGVAFQGSVNESETAWSGNFESFSVYRSWDTSAGYFDHWAAKFEARWHGHVPGFKVYPLPDALRAELVRLAPDHAPTGRDPEEPAVQAGRRTIARFLLAAPHLVEGEALAEATSGVELFPHQHQVVERLAGLYPRSWLVADEVGLGKTISAGLALRRLLLAGRVRRALILAPANVCRQWQDELFERFGLWVPRYDDGKIFGAHPDDVTPVAPGSNPYADHDLLLVSSHLARLPAHRKRILGSPRLDLLVVDEAHHARRRGAEVSGQREYRPSRLLQLLDEVSAADHADALWLLTATPMQVDPVELFDLLGHVGLSGPLDKFDNFRRYHAELAKVGGDEPNWGWLHLVLSRLPASSTSLGFDAAELALLDRIEAKLGAVQRERIERFARAGENPTQIVEDLSPAGRAELRAWLRKRGPVGQLVTRHSRLTLKRYRDQGLLNEPVADRHVVAVPVPFTADEQSLYDDLDGLLDRLMAAHGTRRGVGFVLTVYRRRLTSSWAAIGHTLRRRLAEERLFLDDSELDEADEEDEAGDGFDTAETSALDDTKLLPINADDLADIERYLIAMENVPDSKFDQLRRDIDEARGARRPVIVFTQFTDTLDSLRERLHPAYRSHLATFTGRGGQLWVEHDGHGEWTPTSKQGLVDALSSGRVSVILATDAASEGLNLQSANFLVNYDLPWNPMRVEQRIGRIDRIGQQSPVVEVRNYTVPGTVEEAVYRALADRIDVFSGLLGQLQPILGATEGAFRSIFRAPRSERARVEKAAISGLIAKVDELETSGMDIGDEDPMPIPDHRDTAVTLEQLREVLTEDLDVTLATEGRPVTFDPERASRDPQRWSALGTYGHPMLEPALLAAASRAPGGADHDATLVIEEECGLAVAFRSDRTPPARVRSVTDLLDLGAPLAAGEAAAGARRYVEEAAARRQSEVRAVRSTNRERWLETIRQRFGDLVRHAVRAEQLLRLRADGEAPEPYLVWLSITGDEQNGQEQNGWAEAEAFRDYLGMSIDELLPKGGPGSDARPERELRNLRRSTAEQLVALMEEYVAMQKAR